MSTDVDHYALVWCPGFDINYMADQGVELVAGPFASADDAKAALAGVFKEDSLGYLAGETVIRYIEDEEETN